jgi:hypothetical protein
VPKPFRTSYPQFAKLLKECWKGDPKKRPTFDEIVRRLSGEVMDEVRNNVEPHITLLHLSDDKEYWEDNGSEGEEQEGEGGESGGKKGEAGEGVEFWKAKFENESAKLEKESEKLKSETMIRSALEKRLLDLSAEIGLQGETYSITN